ncbi:hypothetical protein RRF57_009905 [Xylaria bambusicola]|uniref:Uncharacterized protein n=1 Tax=Xylaria bambusicola TaxID=326684 RepID=A0AAN7ZCC3_9PEZI
MEDVRQSNCREGFDAVFRSDLGEGLADFDLIFSLVWSIKRAECFATLLSLLDLLRGLELALAEDVPRSQSHAEVPGHRNDVTLEVANDGVPPALVDAERSLAVCPSISIGGTDNPRRGIGNAEVQDLALLDHNVKSIHDLLDRGCPVPPV